MIQTLFAIDLVLLESSRKSAREVEHFRSIRESSRRQRNRRHGQCCFFFFGFDGAGH